MKGDTGVIEHLNTALRLELTTINQYFLHARMFRDWGFNKLAKVEYEESIDEMKHADRLIERILFLNGLPNVQDLGKVRIGETLKECLECDLAAEMEAHPAYSAAVAYCEKVGDYATRKLFDELIKEEEHHIDFLETQLQIIEKIGEEKYMQSQLGDHEVGED